MITLQAIFDAAWTHFIVGNGTPAYNIYGACCEYLDVNGNKCAIGLCIPDGHEAQKLEGDFQELVGKYPELFDQQIQKMWKDAEERSEKYNLSFSLHNFQSCLHDSLINRSSGIWCFSKERMKNEYLDVAKRYNLTVPE